MKDIVLKTPTCESIIHCGKGAFEAYAPKYRDKQIFIVTDSNVFAIYRYLLWETFGNDFPIIILPAGEKSKNQRNLLKILEEMLKSGMKRNCYVIAFGGGVIGDIAGLSASLYMRGVHLIQIPTTLLSQVDSSVGGKTAVDMGTVKNVMGTFYQPEEVIVDPRFLDTLPQRELRCGLGEIVKYGALNSVILDKLTKNADNLGEISFLEDITYDCINHKKQVVELDERDLSGARKTLNLGHTTGHALELYYGKKSHGEYVLIGMYYELYIAVKNGICTVEYGQNIKNLIFAVLNKIPHFSDIEKAGMLAKYDKKNDDSDISIIVPQQPGKSVELKLPLNKYLSYLSQCAEEIKSL